MNTKENKKKDQTDEKLDIHDKLDIINEKLNQILDRLSPVTVNDEGPKDPGPIPPNP